jgi:hypothetical protein
VGGPGDVAVSWAQPGLAHRQCASSGREREIGASLLVVEVRELVERVADAGAVTVVVVVDRDGALQHRQCLLGWQVPREVAQGRRDVEMFRPEGAFEQRQRLAQLRYRGGLVTLFRGDDREVRQRPAQLDRVRLHRLQHGYRLLEAGAACGLVTQRMGDVAEVDEDRGELGVGRAVDAGLDRERALEQRRGLARGAGVVVRRREVHQRGRDQQGIGLRIGLDQRERGAVLDDPFRECAGAHGDGARGAVDPREPPQRCAAAHGGRTRVPQPLPSLLDVLAQRTLDVGEAQRRIELAGVVVQRLGDPVGAVVRRSADLERAGVLRLQQQRLEQHRRERERTGAVEQGRQLRACVVVRSRDQAAAQRREVAPQRGHGLGIAGRPEALLHRLGVAAGRHARQIQDRQRHPRQRLAVALEQRHQRVELGRAIVQALGAHIEQLRRLFMAHMRGLAVVAGHRRPRVGPALQLWTRHVGDTGRERPRVRAPLLLQRVGARGRPQRGQVRVGIAAGIHRLGRRTTEPRAGSTRDRERRGTHECTTARARGIAGQCFGHGVHRRPAGVGIGREPTAHDQLEPARHALRGGGRADRAGHDRRAQLRQRLALERSLTPQRLEQRDAEAELIAARVEHRARVLLG